MKASCGTNRRQFLKTAAAGGIVALGWPRRLAWALEPAAGPVYPLRILYFTDIHTRLEWETPEALSMAAEVMNSHRPDVALCGGDMITDGYTGSRSALQPRWTTYLDLLHRRLVVEPQVVVGNHDLVGVEPADGTAPEEDPRIDVRTIFGLDRTYRSFDSHGFHFILLDVVQVTRDELKYRGYVDDAQMAWLKADLENTDPATPIVLMSHMPLLTSFYQRTEQVGAAVPANRGVVNNREVLELFGGHRLLLVLQGHLHVNEMIRWGETTFITGGAVCGKWWRGAWHGTGEGFGVLDITRDRVDWSYHTYGWQARRPPGA